MRQLNLGVIGIAYTANLATVIVVVVSIGSRCEADYRLTDALTLSWNLVGFDVLTEDGVEEGEEQSC